ncbi:LOW QUALITY PROTEIN: carbonic anhydrase 15 [Colossoma macropomum]|uniref:LOW QUALITY PROTEIN: carbonic anhydrase 15 n=1 Tax=Colossoma macropomum TaxID=42526 RepID=UPI0018646031|nr:LOW QUALITY PROTEIN: carbonic anhydrase 15 [Colossoma macropomum]
MLLLLLLVLLQTVLTLTLTYDDFCYDDGQCDPYAWGDMFPSCHPLLDAHHSPIDLGWQQVRDAQLDELQLSGFNSTPKGQWRLTNQGHSVVLEVGGGLSVSGSGLPGLYRTVQLHFHWGSTSTNGSEHTLLLQRFPMEMHIVSIKSSHPNLTAALGDPTGLAVLAVFIDLSYMDNENFQPISSALPFITYRGQEKSIRPFPLLTLLPQANLSQYYRYHGSLTTPPCSQAVLWTVYEVPISISWAQFEPFISGIYSTEEGAEPAALLQNNFRHIHPTYSHVYASKHARLLSSAPLFTACPATLPLLLILTALRSAFSALS